VFINSDVWPIVDWFLYDCSSVPPSNDNVPGEQDGRDSCGGASSGDRKNSPKKLEINCSSAESIGIEARADDEVDAKSDELDAPF
jgi:hypothetical protein